MFRLFLLQIICISSQSETPDLTLRASGQHQPCPADRVPLISDSLSITAPVTEECRRSGLGWSTSDDFLCSTERVTWPFKEITNQRRDHLTCFHSYRFKTSQMPIFCNTTVVQQTRPTIATSKVLRSALNRDLKTNNTTV